MAMQEKKAFENRKEDALKAVKEQGIVDVVITGREELSPETVMLAADLMKKHGKAANERIIDRLKNQQ